MFSRMKANFDEIPETLHGAIQYFSQGTNALDVMISRRWPKGVECPHCASKEVTFMASRSVWQCKGCRKQFTVKVGTIFEDSAIKLDKWLSAFWMITNAKNGISSCELHRALGVTQKTGWFMLHRIRLALQNGSFMKLGGMGGMVEVDETYIGGKARNMHKDRRDKTIGHSTGMSGKTAVQGLLDRKGKGCSKIMTRVVADVKKQTVQGNVREYVLKGSSVMTDALKSYEGLKDEYTHEVIDHAVCYAKGHIHTNGLENFWSLLKRSIKGTYVSVEPFHLFRYLDEQSFRYNERKHEDGDRGRFWDGLAGVFGKGLRYAKLIGKDGQGDLLPA